MGRVRASGVFLAALWGIVLAGVGSDLAAQTAPTIESIRGVALVVGNANYANVPVLTNPVNDATDMATALKDLGWDVILVKDAKLTGMKQAVRDFSAKLAGKKAGLFYYAGHGIQVDGTNYLVPTDADIGTKAEIPDVTYSADTVLRTMDDSRVPVKIVILDACRDNPFAKSRSATGGTRGLAPIPSTGGTVVVYATSPGDVSQDGTGRNGVFTSALLKNLKTPGVEFGEIFDLTAQAVSLATGGAQKPRLDKGYYGKLYLISPDEAQKQAETRLAALKAEQDKLTADMAARDTAIAGAKTQAEKDKLQLAQQKAQALAAAQKQEQADLERAEALAENRAAEEAKNKAAATARANDAEKQLVSLRQQAEAQKQKASAASATDDPAAVIARVADLDASLNDIGAQFAASLDRRVAEATKAADARATLIDTYEEEFWENDREFTDRKNQAKALAARDRDNEIAGLKASFAQAATVQTGPLQKQRDALASSLTTRDWPIAAANLSVTRSDFDKDNKSWDFTITCTQPAFTQKLTYKLVYSTSDELKTLAVAADNAWKAGAFAAQAVYSVRPSPGLAGYFLASVSRLDLVDVTKTGKDKKPLVVVSAAAGVPLSWVGKAPEPARVFITVPRTASIWLSGNKLADLSPGIVSEWSISTFGRASLEARYTNGDTETLGVVLSPGAILPANFVQREKPLLTWVRIQGGTFQMGSTSGENDEIPVHSVTVGSFSMSATEVTQAQYQKVMFTNPSQFKGDNRPVEKVSWFDAVAFCNKLSERENRAPAYIINGTTVTLNSGANGYRLPTEAEWEFAARGGVQSAGYTLAGSDNLDVVAWYSANSGSQSWPVGTKKANELGLFDMSGNVWEWVWDWYGSYTVGSKKDPTGAYSGSSRVIRGGGWGFDAWNERSAFRSYYSPDGRYGYLGFRVLSPSF
ncbi:MAG: SUMF1/EgtB/PvdO family nonheme iron enzyme [Spirochaetales bacterium]